MHVREPKMNTAQGSILVKAPIGSVYRRWLRFEDSPQFMTAVKEVEKLDANHFFMAVTCNGKRMEGVLEIMLRVPERRLAWRLVAGKSHCDHVATGVTSFTSQSDRTTRVNVKISFPTVGATSQVEFINICAISNGWSRTGHDEKRATPLEA